jgi:hypothetical protein
MSSLKFFWHCHEKLAAQTQGRSLPATDSVCQDGLGGSAVCLGIELNTLVRLSCSCWLQYKNEQIVTR